MRIAIAAVLMLFFISSFASSSEKVMIDRNGVQVRLVSTTESATIIEVTVGEFYKVPAAIGNTTYYSIVLEHEPALLEKGNPDLACLSRSIAIPASARMSASVINSNYIDFPDMDIAPSKGSLSRKIDPNTVPYSFSNVYNSNQFYPSTQVSLGEPYILRDLRGVAVTITPFAYNAPAKTLRVYTYLQIKIENAAAGADTKNILSRSANSFSRQFTYIYKNRFLNYQDQPQAQASAQTQNSLSAAVPEEGRMIVIAPDNYVAAIQPLVDWKNANGIPTTITRTSQITNTADGIKAFLQSEYDRNDGLTFVLLAGDAAQVPPPIYNVEDILIGAADPVYSLLAGNDDYPDILVGRLSAETADQLTTQVNKIIYYERDMPVAAWQNRALGIADVFGSLGDDAEEDYQHIRNIRTQLLNFGYDTVRELYSGSQGGDDAAGTPSEQDLKTEINNGESLINHCDHGEWRDWWDPPFTTDDANALTNDNMLPYIFSAACQVGNFPGFTCLAETCMRAVNPSTHNNTGAIAFYGSSVDQVRNEPMDAQDEFNRLLTASPQSSFGSLCFNAGCKMIDDYSAHGTAAANDFKFWIVFGDPSLKICKSSGLTFNYACEGTRGQKMKLLTRTLLVDGTQITNPLAGLKFGNAASITADGNLVRSLVQEQQGAWLDVPGNLTGGLIARSLNDNSVCMHISTNGTIRLRQGIISH
jgi:hypothetical protein